MALARWVSPHPALAGGPGRFFATVPKQAGAPPPGWDPSGFQPLGFAAAPTLGHQPLLPPPPVVHADPRRELLDDDYVARYLSRTHPDFRRSFLAVLGIPEGEGTVGEVTSIPLARLERDLDRATVGPDEEWLSGYQIGQLLSPFKQAVLDVQSASAPPVPAAPPAAHPPGAPMVVQMAPEDPLSDALLEDPAPVGGWLVQHAVVIDLAGGPSDLHAGPRR